MEEYRIITLSQIDSILADIRRVTELTEKQEESRLRLIKERDEAIDQALGGQRLVDTLRDSLHQRDELLRTAVALLERWRDAQLGNTDLTVLVDTMDVLIESLKPYKKGGA